MTTCKLGQHYEMRINLRHWRQQIEVSRKNKIVINESGLNRFQCADGPWKTSGNMFSPSSMSSDSFNREMNNRKWVHKDPIETSDIFDAKEDCWSLSGEFIFRDQCCFHSQLDVHRASSLSDPLKYIWFHEARRTWFRKGCATHWRLVVPLSSNWIGRIRSPSASTATHLLKASLRTFAEQRFQTLYDSEWPEVWLNSSQKLQLEKPKLQASLPGIFENPLGDANVTKHWRDACRSCTVLHLSGLCHHEWSMLHARGNWTRCQSQPQDRIAANIFAPVVWTPTSIQDMMKVPEAKAVVEIIWPNGQPNSKQKLWAQPLQLLQLHGHGAHADQPLRQSPRFPVSRRRYRDLYHRSRRFAALRSMQQQWANSSQQSSLNVRILKPLETDGKSRVGSYKARRNWSGCGQRSVATTFLVQSKGERNRDIHVKHSLKDRPNLQKILERKVYSTVQGEIMAHRRLCEAETEVEARNWEKRSSDFADQAQRHKKTCINYSKKIT